MGACPAGAPVEKCVGTKRKWANVSYYASELDENNVGTRVIRGFCGGHSFKLGRGGQKTCEDLVVKVC